MSYRSWLAKAKSIHDIERNSYLVKPGKEWDEKREILAERKKLEELKQPIPVAPEYRNAFGSRMHDSWVMSIDRSASELRVKVDCIYTHIFALGLCKVLDLKPVRSQWPIELVCHDVCFVRAARHDPYGALRFADWQNIRSDQPQKGEEFLYDWFFEQEGRLQWIAQIWDWKRSSSKLSRSVYLMVDCENVSAIDQRETAIEVAYGAAARVLWTDAITGEGHAGISPSIWGGGIMDEFIRERMTARDLDRSSFLSQAVSD